MTFQSVKHSLLGACMSRCRYCEKYESASYLGALFLGSSTSTFSIQHTQPTLRNQASSAEPRACLHPMLIHILSLMENYIHSSTVHEVNEVPAGQEHTSITSTSVDEH